MVLNRNPDNFFAETEQVAFLPTNLPPGIDFSDDPLLQGRTFSYLDTQMSRLGTTNWHQLPINRAKGCPVLNFQRDGHMQFNVPTGRANYEPNSLGEAGEEAGPRETPNRGFHSFASPVAEAKTRIRAETFADHYSQARLFFRSQSATEQTHMVSAFVFELSKVSLEHVRTRVIGNLRNVDETLAKRVATALGLQDLPRAAKAAAPVLDMEAAPSLRLIDKYPPTLKGRAIGVLVTDGADLKLVQSVTAAAEEAGATVKIIASKVGGVILNGGKKLPADGQLAGMPSVLFDAVVLLLSKDGCAALMKNSAAVDFVSNAYAHLKAVGITGHAEPLLAMANARNDAGIVDVSSDLATFMTAAATRQWDREPNVRPAN
jgi:catalase